jgi:imidazoleglycerol-phosphate dehydratase
MEGGEEDTTPRPSPLPPELSKAAKAGDWNRFSDLLQLQQAFRDLARLQHLFVKKTTRIASVSRETAETQIHVELILDGTGQAQISTGVGFFDHMLTLLARHSLVDLRVEAKGDLHVDAHHTVEDVGICLGKALAQALGDKAGIRRYGDATVPMDEALVTAAVDLSGRPFLVWRAQVPNELLGTFNTALAEEFWRAVSSSGALTLHIVGHHGHNAHHIIEAVFKAAARALRQAIEWDPRGTGIPSTKGVLS